MLYRHRPERAEAPYRGEQLMLYSLGSIWLTAHLFPVLNVQLFRFASPEHGGINTLQGHNRYCSTIIFYKLLNARRP
jgi:hypothetical protein